MAPTPQGSSEQISDFVRQEGTLSTGFLCTELGSCAGHPITTCTEVFIPVSVLLHRFWNATKSAGPISRGRATQNAVAERLIKDEVWI